ncbi:MAG: hypothetical protein WBH40_00975 [Ignavibacteriaceae bacterium]|jgi:hypothetical protein
MNENIRKNVDQLVEQFWKRGYLTVSRKFGTYLPEPSKVGSFDVDIIARFKKDYAIGITLVEHDVQNINLYKKLTYLATRHTKYSNKKVRLFVGVPVICFKQAKILIEQLDPDVQKNIKLFQIVDKTLPSVRKSKRIPNVLFS